MEWSYMYMHVHVVSIDMYSITISNPLMSPPPYDLAPPMPLLPYLTSSAHHTQMMFNCRKLLREHRPKQEAMNSLLKLCYPRDTVQKLCYTIAYSIAYI